MRQGSDLMDTHLFLLADSSRRQEISHMNVLIDVTMQ